MRTIKFNEPIPDHALAIDYASDRLCLVDPAAPTKKLTLYTETAPMLVAFPKLEGEGNFADGTDYAAANRRDATFEHNYTCGTLGDDDDAEILADQLKTFDVVVGAKRAALQLVFRDRNEKYLPLISAAEERALREMRAAYAAETKRAKDSITLEAMRAIVDGDAERRAEFNKLAFEEFNGASVFQTPRPNVDMDGQGNLLVKKDGKTYKARLGAQSRNVWGWDDAFKGKKKDQMPPGPSASELAPSPANAAEVIKAMSTHYHYQPYKFFDVNGEIKPSRPMTAPVKRSRDTLAIGTFSYHVYKTSSNQVGVSLKPLGKLYIYRQVKSTKFSDAKDLGARAKPALADSDDEAAAAGEKRKRSAAAAAAAAADDVDAKHAHLYDSDN